MFNYIKYQSQVFINNKLVPFTGIAMFWITFIIHPTEQHFEAGHTPGINRLHAFHEIFP
jgi:hypothetical protein